MMRVVMKILFEDDWRYLTEPIAVETQYKSIRVVLATYELGDEPVLSVKCGLLKRMPANPNLSRHIHAMNPKMYFGRLQLHWGEDATHAVTFEHFLATDRIPPLDKPGLWTVVDTVQYVVERSHNLKDRLHPEFGGTPFADENDGLLVVACE